MPSLSLQVIPAVSCKKGVLTVYCCSLLSTARASDLHTMAQTVRSATRACALLQTRAAQQCTGFLAAAHS